MNSKKFVRSLVLVVAIALILGTNSITYGQGGVKLNLNGEDISIPKDMGSPFIKSGRTLVPIKFISENLGYEVEWLPENMEVIVKNEDKEIFLDTKGKNPLVNGEEKSVDVKPLIKDGRTYVPLRFIGETMGKFVDYDRLYGVETVYISDNEIKLEKPYISKKPHSYERKAVYDGRRTVSTNVVTIDVKDSRIKHEAVLANDRLHSNESFSNMINRKKPIAAINGNFFDAYKSLETYGMIVRDYEIFNKGQSKFSFYLDDKNNPYMESIGGYGSDMTKVKTSISGDPLLVQNGRNVAMENAKGMESKISTIRAQRSAIGITNDKKVVMVTVNGVNVKELAQIMINLNCKDAINLDGGASSALYYNGRYITKPGRKLNNTIMFFM